MACVAALRGLPLSNISTVRHARPSTSAALMPAGPAPTMMTSASKDMGIDGYDGYVGYDGYDRYGGYGGYGRYAEHARGRHHSK